MNAKRILFGIIFGALSGVICIGGLIFFRGIPPTLTYPNDILFLIGGLHNRIVMGILIGFAGDLKIIKDENDPINSIVRGTIFGAILSAAGFFYGATISFFLMGLLYGAVTDLLATYLSKE